MGAALSAPFFLDQEIPLPESTVRALDFLKASSPVDIAEFWKLQLMRTSSLVSAAMPLEEQWRKLIPSDIRPAAAKIELAALLPLMLQLKLGGSRWCLQFIFGFKLVRRLSQCDTFPADPRQTRKIPLRTQNLHRDSFVRFSQRSARSGAKNAQLLWNEALEHHQKGWLTAPFHLETTGNAFATQIPQLGVSFRFGVQQGRSFALAMTWSIPLQTFPVLRRLRLS